MPENESNKDRLFAEKILERKWLKRWGIDWSEYVREHVSGIEGPNHLLFDKFMEKIQTEEWLVEYAISEYEKGEGLTVNEFLRMLIDVDSRPIAGEE